MKNLKLVYNPIIRHYRRRLVENHSKVNIDFHQIKTSSDQRLSVQRQGASQRKLSSPTNPDMDPSRYKVSSASLHYNRRALEDWRVLDKTRMITSSVGLVDMMDRSLGDLPRTQEMTEDSEEIIDLKPINNRRRCGVFLGLFSLSLLLIVPIVSVTLYQFVTCFEMNQNKILGKD